MTPANTESRPARFESWAADIQQRAFALWATVGARSGARVERLLAAEAEGASVPSAATIRRWSAELDWAAQADGELQRTQGQSLRALRAGWISGVLLAQDTLLDGLSGGFDELPHSAVLPRLKSAEVLLKSVAQAGLVVVPPEAVDTAPEEETGLSLEQRARAMRSMMSERHRAG